MSHVLLIEYVVVATQRSPKKSCGQVKFGYL